MKKKTPAKPKEEEKRTLEDDVESEIWQKTRAFWFYAKLPKPVIVEDPNIDGIIVASVHGGYARPQEFTGAIQKMIRERKLHEEYKKPILATWVGGKDFEDLVWDLKSAGVPIYPSSWRTARSMLGLYLEGQRLKREKERN